MNARCALHWLIIVYSCALTVWAWYEVLIFSSTKLTHNATSSMFLKMLTNGKQNIADIRTFYDMYTSLIPQTQVPFFLGVYGPYLSMLSSISFYDKKFCDRDNVMTRREVDQVFKCMDIDRNGVLNATEFLADSNSNGVMDLFEFANIWRDHVLSTLHTTSSCKEWYLNCKVIK